MGHHLETKQVYEGLNSQISAPSLIHVGFFLCAGDVKRFPTSNDRLHDAVPSMTGVRSAVRQHLSDDSETLHLVVGSNVPRGLDVRWTAETNMVCGRVRSQNCCGINGRKRRGNVDTHTLFKRLPLLVRVRLSGFSLVSIIAV